MNNAAIFKPIKFRNLEVKNRIFRHGRMVQASATAAAEQPCAAPIRTSVGSRSRLAPVPPSGE
jgi:2,4-dienoyl-CoA reductase-like NADH-dependent reductase (Old Yellow Enzyme family)